MFNVWQLLQQDTPDFYTLRWSGNSRTRHRWCFVKRIDRQPRYCNSITIPGSTETGAEFVKVSRSLLPWSRSITIFTGEMSIEHMRNIESQDINGITPLKQSVALRLQSLMICNHIDMDKISFERKKNPDSGDGIARRSRTSTGTIVRCTNYEASNMVFHSPNS